MKMSTYKIAVGELSELSIKARLHELGFKKQGNEFAGDLDRSVKIAEDNLIISISSIDAVDELEQIDHLFGALGFDGDEAIRI
jgi:hypothetical protein